MSAAAGGAGVAAGAAARGVAEVTFLGHTAGLNQKELVGLLRMLIGNGSLGKAQQDTIVIELLRSLLRTSSVDTFATEVRAMKPWWDGALSRQWQRLRRAGVSVETWLQSHREMAAVLLDSQDVTMVLQAGGRWGDVGPAVARLTSSSTLGRALFGFAGLLVNSAAYAAEVAEQLDLLFSGAAVSQQMIALFRTTCEQKSLHFGSAGVLAPKRVILLEYNGVQLSMTVQSVALEWEMRLWCRIKNESLGFKGGLALLPYEGWLVQDSKLMTVTKVGEAVLKEMVAGRACAREILEKGSPVIVCFEDMKRLLVAQSSMLCSIDRSFVIDLEFLRCPCCSEWWWWWWCWRRWWQGWW